MAISLTRTLMMLTLATSAVLLGACGMEGMGEEMPKGQPLPSIQLKALHAGMTYGEFKALFGDGWMSSTSGTDAKYWFFDDGRTIAVPSAVWKSPDQKLTYRVIGLAPEATIPVKTTPRPQDKGVDFIVP